MTILRRFISWLSSLGRGTRAEARGGYPTPTGTPALGDLKDVRITSPTNSQVVTYELSTKRWKNTAIPSAVTDHGQLQGLTDDDHIGYARLTGRYGGQTIIGGTTASNNLTLQTTSHVTKGSYILSELTATGYLKNDGSGVVTGGNSVPGVISFVVDGGGAVIAAGIKGDILVPYGCTITQSSLLADQTGTIAVDVWLKAFASYPPTVANSIGVPAISATGISYQSGVTAISVPANSVLRFNVNSCTAVQRCLVALTLSKN